MIKAFTHFASLFRKTGDFSNSGRDWFSSNQLQFNGTCLGYTLQHLKRCGQSGFEKVNKHFVGRIFDQKVSKYKNTWWKTMQTHQIGPGWGSDPQPSCILAALKPNPT